jgi:hypothetical protein
LQETGENEFHRYSNWVRYKGKFVLDRDADKTPWPESACELYPLSDRRL